MTPGQSLAEAAAALFPKAQNATEAICERFMKKTRATTEEIGSALDSVRDQNFNARDIDWNAVSKALHAQRDSDSRKRDDVQTIRDAWVNHEFPVTAFDRPDLPLPHHREILAAEKRQDARHDDIRNWHETECLVKVTANSYANRDADKVNQIAALKFQVAACAGRLRGLRCFGSETKIRWNEMAELVIEWANRLGVEIDLQLRMGAPGEEEVTADGEVEKALW